MEPNESLGLDLLDAEPGRFAFYSWRNIMLACWSTRATGAAVERITRARESMNEQHPEGVSVVYLIASNAGLPTPEARAGVKKLMTRYRDQRACLAIVVQGAGFWAGAMRAAITGVRMLVPEQFPMRVFGDAGEVVEWLPPLHEKATGIRIPRGEFSSVLRLLLATL